MDEERLNSEESTLGERVEYGISLSKSSEIWKEIHSLTGFSLPACSLMSIEIQ